MTDGSTDNYWLALRGLERSAVKVACCVLRGAGRSNAVRLLDYSKHEVDSMLSEAVKEVFAKQDRSMNDVFARQDQKLAEQRREFDARMKDTAKYHDQQLRDNKSELLASRRWMTGTVITVGLSLAAYLSALIHFNH